MYYNQNTEKASEIARNIWLAGLGAYGKALDEAQDQYGKVTGKVNEQVEKVKTQTSEDTTRLFDELVAKGKKLEGDTQERLSEVKDKASSNLEERLAQVKSGLSFTSKSSDLEAKIDAISQKLDLLVDSMGSKPAPKKATKKAASTKKASASS